MDFGRDPRREPCGPVGRRTPPGRSSARQRMRTTGGASPVCGSRPVRVGRADHGRRVNHPFSASVSQSKGALQMLSTRSPGGWRSVGTALVPGSSQAPGARRERPLRTPRRAYEEDANPPLSVISRPERSTMPGRGCGSARDRGDRPCTHLANRFDQGEVENARSVAQATWVSLQKRFIADLVAAGLPPARTDPIDEWLHAAPALSIEIFLKRPLAPSAIAKGSAV